MEEFAAPIEREHDERFDAERERRELERRYDEQDERYRKLER